MFLFSFYWSQCSWNLHMMYKVCVVFSPTRPKGQPWPTWVRWSTGSAGSSGLRVSSPRLPHHPTQPEWNNARVSFRNQLHLRRIFPVVRARQREGSRAGPRYDEALFVWFNVYSSPTFDSTQTPCPMLAMQAPPAAVCAGSVPCLSCSATSTTSATSLPVTTTPTGCQLWSPCLCPWRLWLERASSLTSAGRHGRMGVVWF